MTSTPLAFLNVHTSEIRKKLFKMIVIIMQIKENPKRTLGEVLPYNFIYIRGKWGCAAGSHFHDWIDYNGLVFSIVTRDGVAHFLIFGVRQFFIFMVSKHTRIFLL